MKDTIFGRREVPVYLLEQLDPESLIPYKDYFNTRLSKNNLRPKRYGHGPFVGSYWYPFPYMFREEKFKHLYELPHLKKLKEVYNLSIPLIEEIERISKLRIVKLEINIMPAGTKIDTHVDKWGVLSNCCRIHIPIQTSSDVIFYVNNTKYSIPEGQIFEFNNQIPHSVENNSNISRIHYVFDLVNKEDLTNFEREVSTSLLLANSYFGSWKQSVRREWSDL
jgi:hypothetical protein